jgi:hypothetical protein
VCSVGTEDTAPSASDGELVIQRGLELRELSRSSLGGSCLLAPARPASSRVTVKRSTARFGFFLDFPALELHDCEAGDHLEVANVGRRYAIANFEGRHTDQQIRQRQPYSSGLVSPRRFLRHEPPTSP